MNKSDVVTVKEFKKTICNCRKLIDGTHFNSDNDLYDLTASDMAYIRTMYGDDLVNMLYAAYKLGFARGLKKAANES